MTFSFASVSVWILDFCIGCLPFGHTRTISRFCIKISSMWQIKLASTCFCESSSEMADSCTLNRFIVLCTCAVLLSRNNSTQKALFNSRYNQRSDMRPCTAKKWRKATHRFRIEIKLVCSIYTSTCKAAKRIVLHDTDDVLLCRNDIDFITDSSTTQCKND